ncbi:MAG: YceI family protein [Bacteroidota bacterium]
MKHVFFSFLALLAVSTTYLLAQTTKWTNDKNHTSVKFEVQHLGISIVAGQFMEFEGSMVSDKEDFSDAKINFTIQTKSVNTNVDMRDNDLRSDHFFDAIKYPEMTFKSTVFLKQSDSTYTLSGYLTIKDVTKLVTFHVIYKNTITDPWGNTRTGFRAELTINRFDYHINDKETFGNNILHVAPDVKIIIDTELIKTK